MSRIPFAAIEGFEAIDAVFADFLERLFGSPLPIELITAAALVSRAVREGHSCCRLALWAGQALGEGANRFPLPELDRWLSVLHKPEFRSLVAEPTAPLMIDDAGKVYLRRYYNCEKRIACEIHRRLDRRIPPPDLPPGALSRLHPYFAAAAEQSRIDHQQLAIYTAMSNSFSILSGGPGTGKTTVVTALLALELERNPKLAVALAAPTGKAQSRLAESLADGARRLNVSDTIQSQLLSLPSSTLHRLLGLDPDGSCRHNQHNPLPLDLLVLDECSMVSLMMMGKLFDALPPECRLLLIGDKDQLPSLEAGAVLSDLCKAADRNTLRPDAAESFRRLTGWSVAPATSAKPLSGAVVELTENHRFSDAAHIGRFSRAIRELQGEAEAFRLAGEIARCDAPDFLTRDVPASEMESKLKKLFSSPVYNTFSMTDLRPLAESGEETGIEQAFGILSSFQILCTMRSGKRGIEALNAMGMKLLGHPRLLSPGVPLLITRNDPKTELYNGDIGLVVSDPSAVGALRVRFPGRTKGFLPTELPEYEAVYAMTVHKSQGSGFRNVLLVLPDKPVPILTRELLYTAITRAEERIEVWGSEEMISVALQNRTVRQSGLYDKLCES